MRTIWRTGLVLVYLVLAAVICYRVFAVPQDIYFAQVAAGSNNGTNCANSYNVARFNTNDSNWTAGNTLHLCGTFTGSTGSGMLTAQASGSAGNPITILFEANAVLTAPYWSGSVGAINLNSKSFITVNGGTNGTIQNTANGTNLANQQNSIGIEASHTTSATIENLLIQNIYVHVVPEANISTQQVPAIHGTGCVSLTITGNTIHDVGWALPIDGFSLVVTNNNIYNMSHGIAAGGSGVNQSLTVAGNQFHDYAVWDATDDAYHLDGVHVWGQNGGTWNGVLIYNNTFYGNPGSDVTAHIYIEESNSNDRIFNNVFLASTDPTKSYRALWFNGNSLTPVGGAATNNAVYNNYLDSTGGTADTDAALRVQFQVTISIENNVFRSSRNDISIFNGSTIGTVDFNLYEDAAADWPASGSNTFAWQGNNTASFTVWKSNCSCDSHSQIFTSANMLVSASTGHLQAGSPAIGAGTNLTSLGITPLDTDAAGVPRPGGATPWDVGAFQFNSTAPAVGLSPSSLAFGNQVINTSSAGQVITLTNTGTSALHITTTTLTTGTQYALSSNTCASATVNAGNTCALTVTFTPTSTGAKSDTLSFADDAAGSPQTLAMSGTGISVGPPGSIGSSVAGGAKFSGGGSIH